MQPIQKLRAAAVLGALLANTLIGRAENTTLQQRLESEYALTSINAEGAVVTQGATLALKKTGLTASTTYACANEYKSGKIASVSKVCTASRTVDKLRGLPWLGSRIPDAPQGTTLTTRPFARDEKFYIIGIMVADGIAFSLISDAIENVTYKAEIRFKTQDLAQADRMVAEVFGVTPPDNPQGGQQVAPPAIVPPPPPPPDQVPPAIVPPPPPPPDTPTASSKTISLGQPISEVVAILGQPKAIADLGSKKIYSYSQVKLIFVDGRVTDVQ
jgi:hypothetical protein